jgi:hypothetical protein
MRVEVWFCWDGVDAESPDVPRYHLRGLDVLYIQDVDEAWARAITNLLNTHVTDLVVACPYPMPEDSQTLRIVIQSRSMREGRMRNSTDIGGSLRCNYPLVRQIINDDLFNRDRMEAERNQ